MTIEPGQSEGCRIVCARVRFREICFQRAKKKKKKIEEEEKKNLSALDYFFWGGGGIFRFLSFAVAVRCMFLFAC